ncbi:hypothetical protein DYB25_007603 [Aphanomyces astaci]|uniref:Secreted protein n=1 Tax=Aphanomyces astaci TaxID=112090 RepID=A0A397EXW1_APHAT|nr:hypothetical protein DYB25_007603 [Aphanomyces astaci]RHY41360.1 hypothetical protein DYB38_008688 [Aphanomyces astaci]RHY73600.1 hypothetical protein DYB30_008554 [Aphanomyces astaci]RHY76703.1 hypothetical protein DYB34_009073 [Aphanomyces astaci]RHZ04672.1 hypothetical protein DYB31_012045 [Aphanomyces astaci]
MKFTLVCALVLAAVASVVAQNDTVPAGFVVFDHGLVVATGPPLGGDLESAVESASLVDIVQDFELVVRNGMQDFKTITSLVQLIQTIATSGLTVDNGMQFVSSIQNAIQIGALRVKEGKDLVKDIKDIVAQGQLAGPQAVADIKKALQRDMKPATAADLISDLQKVIQNSSNDVTTTLNLVKLIQSIQRDGLDLNNGQILVQDIQKAIAAGFLHLKDGANLVGTIQDIVKDGMTLQDGALVADAIQQALQAALAPFDPLPMACRRKGEDRGAGTFVQNQCEMGEEAYGALCYPTCKEGYEKVGCCICRKKGCSGVEGVTDIGVSCTKPTAYGRGVGYALWQEDKCKADNAGTCDKYGLMWYPHCQPGFHRVGCCICSPDCPAGTNDDGAFCRKDSYGVGVGVSRLGCPAGKDKSGVMCYPPCAPTLVGNGPVCWPQCFGATPFKCGLFCTSTASTCFSTSIEILGSTVKVALSLVDQDFSGAGSSAAQGVGNVLQISECPTYPATPLP